MPLNSFKQFYFTKGGKETIKKMFKQKILILCEKKKTLKILLKPFFG